MSYTYLCNAFSLQMIKEESYNVVVTEIAQEEFEVFKPQFKSAIGHEDTANVLGVEFNRVSISLKKGDTILVAQLCGGRLPEGSTELPEGFEFRFMLVTIK